MKLKHISTGSCTCPGALLLHPLQLLSHLTDTNLGGVTQMCQETVVRDKRCRGPGGHHGTNGQLSWRYSWREQLQYM